MFPLTKDENEAQLQYKEGEYRVLAPGTYVLCAVTGKKIPLDELKYWSLQRQEAYLNSQISYTRELECNPELKKIRVKREK
ncbi:MAG: hypothetical protein JSC161_000858 [Candidatus Tokpelaia sp. JSC161]|jgi:hypothetical protein|nr:MAG: hypothetical protein JSC161_000858 [Candidatus Tokpelaia sp. JSC161]